MKRSIPARTIEKQHAASDPRTSAWVSAHAGSGKTHVLTQRVVRLLLDRVQPSHLICLTFTKAAAANMAERVFRTLAGWTLLDDDALREEIRAAGAEPPDDLDAARRLFATAVETPGGLKIQTIHAFCERVLHLFPFEANAPADFRVVDDLERVELMQTARRLTLAAAADDPELGPALARVAVETWDGGFEQALDEAFARRDMLRDVDGLIARLPVALGLIRGEDEASIERAMVEGGIASAEWAAVGATLAASSKVTDARQADKLVRAASLGPSRAQLDEYLSIFFTDRNQLRKSIVTKDVEKLSPGLPARLLAEGERLESLRERLRSASACARSDALLRLAGDCLARYEALKRTRSLLDFDDLIGRTRALLARDGASAWVLYKLDGGVDHILVDEAQDTSEAQWDILRALASEFSVGAGARSRLRTFFAVGDEKQSIFSFQGAAPAAFDRMKRYFDQRTRDARQRFEPVTLDLSFRSAPRVLEAVDLVFAQPEAARGLTVDPDAPPHHYALKKDVVGLVEIWAPIAGARAADPESWVLPVDLPRESDPAVELARRIASKIAGFIAPCSPERVHDSNSDGLRPIHAGDVMILVRRRGPFFEAMVRALKEAKVPVAGADRLNVGQHIAVMDMVAAARATLAPDDDLSLACVLKSPLCGLTDDDLMVLAPRRAGSLWSALVASHAPSHRAAAARIEGWRSFGQEARPFDFFSRLLGPEEGRKRFLQRLGPEAGDALDELMALALDHERSEAPSLAAFAHQLETIDLTVKRDMETGGAFVRVMTVHAAKGLEAKIVFLPDTCSTPSPGHDAKLFELETTAGPALAWSQRKDDDPPVVADRRAARRAEADDEYRRLLYVAMTRAEERLYVAGYHSATEPKPGCWRNLIVGALVDGCVEVADPEAPGGIVWRFGAPNVGVGARGGQPGSKPIVPDWLLRAAPAERESEPPIRPSNALAGADAPEPAQPELAGRRAATLLRGQIVHRLLQSLPGMDASRRARAALQYIRAQAPSLSEAEARATLAEAEATLAAPACVPLFGERSRAEAAFAARIARAGRPPLDISGRIDRMAEVGDEVWIADFKTGARPAAPPEIFVTQLALYRAAVERLFPGRAVRAFIVWTAAAHLQEIASHDLERALARL